MVQSIRRGDLRAPALVLDIDVNDFGEKSDASSIDVKEYRSIYCLIRRNGIPVSITFWDSSNDNVIDVVDLITFARAEDAAREDSRAEYCCTSDETLTVVVCTRERPRDLRRALASLEAQSDQSFALLVVDNAPLSSATEAVVSDSVIAGKSYVVEPRAGLARARNRALDNVNTELLAWFDDDEVADRDWVARLRQGFAQPCRPAAVAGLMLPAELFSEAQVRFEQYGGFNKGRGVTPEVLQTGLPTVRNPLYPLPGFGAGGNMAFRTEALHLIGGFDDHLGAGTRTHGGEETLAFVSLLQRGGVVLHWPAAITWHYHRRDMAALERQMFGYSAGLSAFYASLLLTSPMTGFEILKVAPLGVRDALSRGGSARSGQLPKDFPANVLKEARRGFALGAFLYVQEVLEARKASRK